MSKSKSKMDPKKRETLITFSIFGAMILIIAAIAIVWSIDYNNSVNKDSVLIYKVDCAGKTVDESTLTYEFDELTSDQGLADLKPITGIIPILPTDGVLKNYVVRGAAKCTPVEDGVAQTDDNVALVRMIDSTDETNYIYIYVSKSDTLKIPGDYEPYGVDPHDTDESWSYLNGYAFKLYQVTFGDMDTDLYFALFTRGNRAWRIEFTGLGQDDVTAVLSEFFYSEAT